MWRTGIIISALILCIASFAESQIRNRFELLEQYYAAREVTQADQFKHLSTVTVEHSIVRFFPEGIRIHYVDSLSTVINEEMAWSDGEDTLYTNIRLLKTKINSEDTALYTIDFSPGMSADPHFIVYRNDGEQLRRIGWPAGTELYAPGDGFLYVSGHTNSMFNQRRKYYVDRNRLREVRQPLYYVGMDSETLGDMVIYADVALAEEVERIPAGSWITVLVNTGDFYLVVTTFGVTGWIKVKSGYYDSPIRHLFYRGD